MSFWVSPNSPKHHSSSYERSHAGSHAGSSSYSKHRSSDDRHRSSDDRRRSSDDKPQYYMVRPGSSSRSTHSTSHYSSSRARPRDGYMHSLLRKIKRLLRRLYDYARRHPMKLFMLVIMPLITGGALADLLKRFGVRLPRQFEHLIPGMGARSSSFGKFGGGGGGGADSIEGVMKIAKMFI